QTIPVVDLDHYRNGDATTRQAFIEAFGSGIREFGFVAVEGHGVDTALVKRNYALYQRFFALDDTLKARYEDPATGRQRGYTSFGVEHAKDHDRPDLKEFWHLGRDLPLEHPLKGRLPDNVWPEEIPELKGASLDLFRAMERCAMDLLGALSVYLNEPEARLPDLALEGNSIIRVIHYPACEGFTDDGAVRAAQHEDINLITLLPEATQGGLEILTRGGDWMPIHAIPGQLVVDSGDMLKRLTNDTIPATTHRVVNPADQTTSRYSMPFFVHPHPDAMLKVLDSCLEEGAEPRYAPITADDYLKQRLKAIGVA
ncbi:MAG: 2-oxoglutarate and iron-dependent oxygenase domain-containing protein, partial [Myxococcota bacterium]